MSTRFVTLLVLAAGGGCVARDNDTFSPAQSRAAGDALANGIEDGAATFGPVNAGGAGFDASCVTMSGNTADGDGDNIPTSATLTFACSETRLGYIGTVTGTETATDTQPAAAAWAFTAMVDLQGTLTGPNGASIVTDRSGQIEATQASAVGPFELARTLDVVTVFTSATHSTTTVIEANDWTIRFAPQVSWTPGGAMVTGSVIASGTWDATIGSATAHATLATPAPLTVTPLCATRVTSGTLTATYQGPARDRAITVTWTGCGQRTVTEQ